MRGAMLECLEAADQRAELLALFQIADGHVHRAARDAQHFRRRAGAARPQQPVEPAAPTVDLPDHRIGIDGDAVEGHPRGEARIGQPLRRRRKTRGIARHREQRHAIGILGRPRGAGRDDH